MELTYANNKDCSAYENLMNNPSDRVALKSFTKVFSAEVVKPSIKLDQRLKSSTNAKIFNQNYPGDNSINLLGGVKDKDPLVLKVRIQDAYRKFFNFYDKESSDGDGEFCVTKLWVGQFEKVEKLYIYEINKHNYKK